MRHISTFLLLLLFSLSAIQAQESKTTKSSKKKLENPFETNGDINLQFDYLFKKSGTYQEYKVIKITLFNELKKSVLDSITSQEKIITEKNEALLNSEQEVISINEKLSNTEINLDKEINLKNSRFILGVPFTKTLFSTIIALSYFVLLILLAFFIFKFKQNLNITKKAVADKEELETEFEEHKKSSLKRLQEVNRKLQDELNKNWKKEK